jgi:DNA modification methylase
MPENHDKNGVGARKWRNRIVGHGEEDPEQLLANPRNWRIHPKAQQDALRGVLSTVGWVQDVIVNQRTGFVVDGHARVAMAISAGERVPVVYVDLSEAEEALILATFDPISSMAAKDSEIFDDLVKGMDESFRALVAATEALRTGSPGKGLTDEDAVPEIPKIPTSVCGDLWILGNHRLLVGDATHRSAVARLMAGDSVDLVFSDLPYNCAYEGYTKDKLTIQNDNMSPEQFDRFLRDSFASFRTVVKPGASLYVCHSSSFQREFQNALEAAGFEVRCQIIWAKNTFAWGFGRYKFQHEPIFYCHVEGQSDAWYGDKSQSTLWEENKPSANRLHPTMKPVELIERALLNSSKAGDVVADLFGGSGSTLIACERHNRFARLIEIDPKYADVIVQRWQEYTGKQAMRESDGRTFAEIDSERKSVPA